MAADFTNPWGPNGTYWAPKWMEENTMSPQALAPNTTTEKKTRMVTITVTSKKVGKYEARSYPDDDINNNGKIELYEVDTYEILINGTDDTGNPQTFNHTAPRFMPYWNDPESPDPHYKYLGWTNAGLSSKRTVIVKKYLKDYQVRNRFSPGRGAIVVTGSFYIHAGPADESDYGFGSAGCIEIIGNFDDFKNDIQSVSGYSGASDDAILELIKEGNLKVIIEEATVPDIKANFTREI